MTTPALSTQWRPTRIFFARLFAAKSQDIGGLGAWKAFEGLVALGWVVSYVLSFDSVNIGVLRPTLPANTLEGTLSVHLSLERRLMSSYCNREHFAASLIACPMDLVVQKKITCFVRGRFDEQEDQESRVLGSKVSKGLLCGATNPMGVYLPFVDIRSTSQKNVFFLAVSGLGSWQRYKCS